MEEDKSNSEVVDEYQKMIQELNIELNDLSLNKDAVEQAIIEQCQSVKAALDKYCKSMLEEVGRLHHQRRMHLWGQIDRCEKISEKMTNHRGGNGNHNDGLIEELDDGGINGGGNGITGNGSTSGCGSSLAGDIGGGQSKDASSELLACSLTDKSNCSPSNSSFLDFGRDSSPIGVGLKSLKNVKSDHIIFNPVDLATVESMLLPHLFGTLKIDKSNGSEIDDTNCSQTNGFSFPVDDLTPHTPTTTNSNNHHIHHQSPRATLTNDANNISNSLTSPAYNNTVAAGTSPLPPRSVPIAVPTNSPSHQLDLNDYITRVNLTKLAILNENTTAAAAAAAAGSLGSIRTRIPSVSSSISNSPSPQPQISSSLVPYENSGLVLNETTVNNLNELAKFSNNPQNGIESHANHPTPYLFRSAAAASSATGPGQGQLVSPAPPTSAPPVSGLNPIPMSSPKCNIMQIRCKFGQLGSGKGYFSSPHGFCLGVDEDIVIADTNNHRICIFDKSGEFKFQFGVQGKEEGQLWYPRKVAMIRTPFLGTVAPRYVVCDRGTERSRMQIFTSKGHFIRKIGVRYIDIVAGLAITPKGHIVAVDSVSPTIFVIAETGDLLRWFDCSPYMREPSDVAVNGREFYVCDFKGSCVVVFGEDGQFKRRIGKEKVTDYPNGIDFSDAGDILVGDSHGNRFHVVVFDKNGTLLSEFECPYVKVSRCCGLKITSEGYVVTLAKNNHHVLVLNTLYVT